MAHPDNYPSQSTNSFHGGDTSTFENGVRIPNPFDLDDTLPEQRTTHGSYTSDELMTIREAAQEAGVIVPDTNEGLIEYLHRISEEARIND